MDPNLNYNFTYGDTYGGSGATDPANDPNAHYGWSSQWSQPASAASQVAGAFQFPQYVSPQQQQQQQAQQQAQQAYAALNPISTFMQQQQKPQFQQQQQKKFGQYGGNGGGVGGAPKPQTRSNHFGAFGGGVGGNTGVGGHGLGSEWVQPMSQSMLGAAPNMRTFPGKGGSFGQNMGAGSHGGNGHQNNKPNWRQNKQQKAQMGPKKFDTTGKTPAMILHEVFKNVGEEYKEVEGATPKRYRCTLTLSGREFQMESPNKKAAKQKCAELVVRELRPDLHVTPFEEGITAKAVPVKKDNSAVAGNVSQPTKRNADEMLNQPTQKKVTQPASAKKPKLSPVESALSLLDLMQKIIAESTEKYVPVFEAMELPREDEQVEPPKAANVKVEPMDESIKQEESEPVMEEKPVVEAEKRTKFRKCDIKHSVTLKFADQNKEYNRVGVNRGMLKDMVIREALKDLFLVSQQDITTVARRHASNRLGSDMNLIQCLHTICSVLNCSVVLEAEPAEDRPLGEGRMYFMGRCTIKDMNDDNTFETKSPTVISKTLAKEYAAQEMLKSYFEIDAETCCKTNDSGVNSQGPCATLHAMLNKQTRQKTKIVYEFKDNVPPVAGNTQTVFYCDCVIDEKDRYTGSGRSKKLAKNDAAQVALKKIFKIDFDPNSCYPLALSSRSLAESKVSPLCKTISEFCKREYHDMTRYYHHNPSNQIACFVLVNEKDEKRLLSVGSSIQYVVEPDTLSGANGTTLIHLDPIVLARRGLIRNFMSELQAIGKEGTVSILEEKDDGRFGLKPNLRLVLYSNYSPACIYSVDDAPLKSLSYVTPTSFTPVPPETMTLEEIRAKKTLRIHCAADKLFKWNNIGVQGALLSNVMHPVYISHIFFGSEAPVSDESLKYALVNRMGPLDNERDVNVESNPLNMRAVSTTSHVWTRGIDEFQQLDLNTGRTSQGSPSRVSKAELFQTYRTLPGVDQSIIDYSKAKEMASEYQYEKKVFYDKMEAAGLGKWQTKPAELVDAFTPPGFD